MQKLIYLQKIECKKLRKNQIIRPKNMGTKYLVLYKCSSSCILIKTSSLGIEVVIMRQSVISMSNQTQINYRNSAIIRLISTKQN
jgi:hypothetical protein